MRGAGSGTKITCSAPMGLQDDSARAPSPGSRRDRGPGTVRHLLLASALLLAAWGCGEREGQPTQPNDPPATPDLEAPLGGFTAADEEPAFGEPSIAEMVEAEMEFEDPIGDDPEFVTLASDPRVRSYAVSILWGRLDRSAGDSPAEDQLDWSGRLRLSRGAALLERVVDFEPVDQVAEQRFNARELRWSSHEGAGHDGLRISIWNRNTLAADSLYIETGPFAGAWAVEDLASIDFLADIADTDQQIAIRGIPISGELREGFAQGYWREAHDDGPAEFAGRWMGARGEVVGFVRGIYGSTVAGERVLFGKWIDREGTFRGFLRGTWNRPPDFSRLQSAEFEADLLAPSGSGAAPIGRVQGRWRIGSGQGEGAFEARWCLDC